MAAGTPVSRSTVEIILVFADPPVESGEVVQDFPGCVHGTASVTSNVQAVGFLVTAGLQQEARHKILVCGIYCKSPYLMSCMW